jgi:hypothetical protein
VGSNEGGLGVSSGIFSKGLPLISRTMRKCSGSLVAIGQIFFATGLYFSLAANIARGVQGVNG